VRRLLGVVGDVAGDRLPGQRRKEGDAEEDRQAVVAQEATHAGLPSGG
jgi:hypothetical protein